MTRRAVVLFARTPEAEAAAKGLPRVAADGAIAHARDGGIDAIGFVSAAVARLKSFRVGDRPFAAGLRAPPR